MSFFAFKQQQQTAIFLFLKYCLLDGGILQSLTALLLYNPGKAGTFTKYEVIIVPYFRR